jgi:BirA family biotin operon repressor/biotin-[acetyl-CoA-carboxylase] ligase
LIFSIILKYAPHGQSGSPDLLSLQAHDQQIISQITSNAVVDLLAAHGIEARIKWPNDIYVGDKKICGILIENTILGKWMNSSIIGIGLNVNQKVFDANLPNPTSMALCSEIEEGFNTEDLLNEYMQIFIGYINRFCTQLGLYKV